MKNILGYLNTTFVAAILILAPLAACKSAKMSSERQAEYDQAIEDGDTDKARRLQEDANREQAGGYIDFFLGLVPAIPDTMKGVIGTVTSGAVAAACFERPRGLMKSAAKRMTSLEMIMAARDLMAAFGAKHTTDNPDEVIANGEKLKARMEAKNDRQD